MNFRLFPRILPLILICVSSCSLAERDNENDPSSSDYSIKGYISSATGLVLAGHEPITISFDDAMDSENVNFDGSDLIEGNYVLKWGTEKFSNDTLTISMNPSKNKAFLKQGASRKIVVNSRVSVAFTVENRIYVRTVADGGSDGNTGTANYPVATIRKGIALAKSIYDGASARVMVAEGTYTNSADVSKAVFDVSEGISVCGGYSKSDWNKRAVSESGSPSTYETIVENICTTLVSPESGRSSAILIAEKSGVTRDTVLEGMTIKPGVGRMPEGSSPYGHAAILCNGSPVIRYNYLPGRTVEENPGNEMIGICCKGGSPLIINNTIRAGANAGVVSSIANSDFAACYLSDASYAIYLEGSSARVEGNILHGGAGSFTCGVACWGVCSPEIVGNVSIDGGRGTTGDVPFPRGGAYGIWILSSSPKIERNTIVNESKNFNWYAIFESPDDGLSDPSTVSNNVFTADCGNVYYDDGGVVNDIAAHISLSNSVSGTLSAWRNTIK